MSSRPTGFLLARFSQWLQLCWAFFSFVCKLPSGWVSGREDRVSGMTISRLLARIGWGFEGWIMWTGTAELRNRE